MAQYRAERLGQEILRFVSETLQFEMRDPRLHLASITRVEVSKDLRHAKVYVSAVTPEDRDAAAQVLQGARGYLRKGLADRLTIHLTPELHFLADKSVVAGDNVLAMLRQLSPLDEIRDPHDSDFQ